MAAAQLVTCLVTDPRAQALTQSLSTHFHPPVRQTLSQWAETNIILSSEYSARSGPIRLFGWQREIFDSFTDPYTRGVVAMVGVQMVKTLALQSAMAYIIDQAPGPILMVHPTEDDGKEFSKERITPMIRDCACLSGKITDAVHDNKNTILGKSFPGGRLSIVSAQKPGNLARRSIRYLLCDEIDKYPKSAGKEGDPRSLAKQRLVTFGSRSKFIEVCSPTTEGESAIESAYNASDQRKPYVKCPKCGLKQLIMFGNVKIDTTLAREKIADAAYLHCSDPECNHRWTDVERWRACESAEWVAAKPFNGVAGFWISHLYSPWKKIRDIVEHFLTVKDDREQLQVFINTVLAELWREKGETPDAEHLYSRREDYPFGNEAIIPQRGLFLTAGVDVQENPPRLECEVKAWGRNSESWSVAYYVLQCTSDNDQPLPVTSPELWDLLDSTVLQRDWVHESGKSLQILCMAVDTGYKPKVVYDFALKHPQILYTPQGIKVHSFKTVVPTKGNDDPLKLISSVSKETAAAKRQHVRIVFIGTHRAKQQIFDSLRNIVPDLTGRPKPGCFHHPMYERPYFDQLCSESRIITKGKVVYQKRADTRNEALDTCVLNLAAAAIVGIDRFTEEYWRSLEMALAPLEVEDETGPDNPPAPETLVSGQPALQTTGEVAMRLKAALIPAPKSIVQAQITQPQPQSQPLSQPPRRPGPPRRRVVGRMDL